jgi:AraC family transcriptional regulator, regulatory protein of adaptative response / DNA-3-methyladenine glycosylase II
VLGQQVSVAAARRLVSELVRLAVDGEPPATSDVELARAFPTPERVVAAAARLRMPASRQRTLVALAEAAATDARLFHPRETVEDTVARLCAVRGIGEWTAHYIALRAAREPDAFPATDAALVRVVAALLPTLDVAALARRAERWRPWRAYAAQHLWAADRGARA